MPPDPTALLEAAKREAHEQINIMRAHYATGEALDVAAVRVHKAIDRALRIAEKVGEIRGHEERCGCVEHPDIGPCSERDRLLAELEGRKG